MKEGWKYVKLEDIATNMFRGSGIKRDQVTSEGYPCIRYGEIYTTYNIAFEKCMSHTIESIIPSPKYIEPGDILFAITGESVEEIGKSIAYLGKSKCLVGGDIAVMQHKQNPKYLAYALSSPNAVMQKGLGKTKLKVVHTNIPSLKEIKIPLPSLSEQQRIVTFLDTEFAKIDALKAKAEQSLQNAKALFQAALKEEMTPKKGWEEKTLGSISNLITKGASPKWQGIQYVTDDAEGVLFVTSENVRDGYVDIKPSKYVEKGINTIQKRSILKYNDLLINIVGASIGRAAIYSIPIENANINQAVALVRCNNGINLKYILYFLNSDFAMTQYNACKKDTARANLSLKNISDLVIPYPSLDVQQRIVTRLDTLGTLVSSLKQKYAKIATECDALKQALLRETFE